MVFNVINDNNKSWSELWIYSSLTEGATKSIGKSWVSVVEDEELLLLLTDRAMALFTLVAAICIVAPAAPAPIAAPAFTPTPNKGRERRMFKCLYHSCTHTAYWST